MLKQQSIDVNIACYDGATPLYTAAYNGHVEIVSSLLQYPGIDVNKAANDNVTPLKIATLAEYEDIVQLLLNDIRVNIHARDNDGDNARKIVNDKIYGIIDREIQRRQKVATIILKYSCNGKLPTDIVQLIGSFV